MIQRLIDTYREAYGGLPPKVWLISLVLLVARAGTMVIPFLSLYFTKELGFSPAQIGWLLGGYGIGGIIAGLLGGYLTQRFGAIPTQALSLALAAVGFLLLSQVQSFASALACLFYLSVTAESMRPASVTATVEFCDHPDQHAKALAVNRLAINLGLTVGPAVGGGLASIDFSLLFYVNAGGELAALICLLMVFGLQLRPISPVTSSSLTTARSPWRDGRLLAFAVLTILASIVFFQIMATFPLYLAEFYQMQEWHIGLLFAVNTVLIVLFELVLVNYVKRFALLRVVAWGQFLSCVGFGVLPLAVGTSLGIGFTYVLFTVVVWTIGEMLAMPLGAAYVAQRSTEHNRGAYMGLFVTAFSVAAVIGPLGGMWVYQWNPHAVWYGSLILGSLVFVAFLKMAEAERKNGERGAGTAADDEADNALTGGDSDSVDR